MAFCKILTVLVVIFNIGGLLGAEVRSSIIGGKDAPKGKWPWMTYINITSDGIKTWRCGGSILNSQWVLTAASCWDTKLKPNWPRSMVWVGSHSLQKGADRYMGVNYVIPHPGYQGLTSGYVNDIALVQLKKKLNLAQYGKVNLPKENANFDASSECWITGWGNIGNGVPLPSPEILQELQIPIVSDDDCKAEYPGLTSDMLCAGDMAGGKDACTGDYGDPLVCRTANDFVQVGIMSYENPEGCGLRRRPSVYTKVSKYLRFINDYVHQANEASAEV